MGRLTLAFIIMITLMKFDYGPMAVHEKNALEKGDLFTSGTEHEAVEMEKGSAKGKVLDLIVPIVVLIVISVVGLLYVGGMFDGESFVDAVIREIKEETGLSISNVQLCGIKQYVPKPEEHYDRYIVLLYKTDPNGVNSWSARGRAMTPPMIMPATSI